MIISKVNVDREDKKIHSGYGDSYTLSQLSNLIDWLGCVLVSPD